MLHPSSNQRRSQSTTTTTQPAITPPTTTTGSATIDALVQLVTQQSEIIKAILPTATAATQQTNATRVGPGADVNSILLADALRGQDNPTWRLAPGLILPRFLPERFCIFSIPHLLFRQDAMTHDEMVKVPKGTALTTYCNLLPSARLCFPNQVPFRISNPVAAGKAPQRNYR